jgi:hypothetical protein
VINEHQIPPRHPCRAVKHIVHLQLVLDSRSTSRSCASSSPTARDNEQAEDSLVNRPNLVCSQNKVWHHRFVNPHCALRIQARRIAHHPREVNRSQGCEASRDIEVWGRGDESSKEI